MSVSLDLFEQTLLWTVSSQAGVAAPTDAVWKGHIRALDAGRGGLGTAAERKVAGLIPGQGRGLGRSWSPIGGSYQRQPMDVSLPSPSL